MLSVTDARPSRDARRAIASSLLAAASFAVHDAPAAAAESGAARREATYGRIAGDVTLAVGAGVVASAPGTRVEGEVRARYLETAGFFAAYEEGAAFGSRAAPTRLVAIGLEMRPLFLLRWLRGTETERAPVDLTVDSLGLELGATLSQRSPGSSFSDGGFQVSGGLEVPFAPQATGPWLGIHGGLRFTPGVGAPRTSVDNGSGEAFVAFTLAWHQVIAVHLVDFGDEAPR